MTIKLFLLNVFGGVTMCDKMALSAYILKIVENDPYLRLHGAPRVSLGFYVTLPGTLVSQYLQTYRTIIYLLDLEVPELSST